MIKGRWVYDGRELSLVQIHKVISWRKVCPLAILVLLIRSEPVPVPGLRSELWGGGLCLSDIMNLSITKTPRPPPSAPVMIFPLIIIASISPDKHWARVSPRVTTCLLMAAHWRLSLPWLRSALRLLQRRPELPGLIWSGGTERSWAGLGWAGYALIFSAILSPSHSFAFLHSSPQPDCRQQTHRQGRRQWSSSHHGNIKNFNDPINQLT